MKMMKLALLGGAAFAVMTAGAQADDLSALKAEIEALNARVAQLETAPAIPSGYSLMTYTQADATVVPGAPTDYRLLKGYGDKAAVIGILPAADAPATTTVEWSGYVYAIVAHTSYEYTYDDDSRTSVIGRAQLKVVGKTDTAVGEVGVRVQLRSTTPGVEGDRRFFANEYWGWWAMTPELTLGGGYTGSLGNIGYGMDGACNCWWTDWYSSSSNSYRNGNFDGTYDPGDTQQLRLSWQSGPIGLAVALEESDAVPGGGGSYFGTGGSDDLAVAGQVTYSGDTINGEISAIAYEADSLSPPFGGVSTFNDSGFQVGAGVGFGLGSIANVSLAAAFGQEPLRGDYWGASGLVSFNLTDTVSAEVGANYKKWTDTQPINTSDDSLLEVLAGVYYNPVSQLTFGLEAEAANTPSTFIGNAYSADNFTGDTLFTFDFVSIWRF